MALREVDSGGVQAGRLSPGNPRREGREYSRWRRRSPVRHPRPEISGRSTSVTARSKCELIIIRAPSIPHRGHETSVLNLSPNQSTTKSQISGSLSMSRTLFIVPRSGPYWHSLFCLITSPGPFGTFHRRQASQLSDTVHDLYANMRSLGEEIGGMCEGICVRCKGKPLPFGHPA